MRIFAWALTVIVAGTPSGLIAGTCRDGSDPAALYKVGAPYRQCEMSVAKRLEISGESPEDVSTASLAQCQGERSAVQKAVTACHGDLVAQRTLEKVDQGTRDDIVSYVVTIRAARKSRGG